MAYTPDLLNPVWWIESLLGSIVVFMLIVQLWLLTYIRRIPNSQPMLWIFMMINIIFVAFGWLSAEGFYITKAFMALILVIIGFIMWRSWNSAKS